MDFLKRHYEKILLGVVLLGLVAFAVYLIIMIPAERAALNEQTASIINRPPKPLPPLDLKNQETLLQSMQTTIALDLSSAHRVFNPMLWRRRPADNAPIKDLPRNIGPGAVVITKIAPLHITISLDQVTTSDAGARYVMGVEREAAANPAQRKKKLYYPALNTKNDAFILREIKGPADNPDSLLIELSDTAERVSVNKREPYRRVDGYTADLKYPPDNNRAWLNQRNNGVIRIDGEDYIIVGIRKDEVILSAKLNDKKTTIPYTAAVP